MLKKRDEEQTTTTEQVNVGGAAGVTGMWQIRTNQHFMLWRGRRPQNKLTINLLCLQHTEKNMQTKVSFI